jgi:hypothetical protein
MLAYVGVTVWAVIKFSFGRGIPEECEGSYENWMWVYVVSILLNATVGRCAKHRLGYRSGEPEPQAVKRLNRAVCAFYVLLFAAGLLLAPGEEAQRCRHPVIVDEETGDVEPGDAGYFASWVALCALGVFVQALIWGGLGLFAYLAVWLARNGYLSDEGEAAPEGTAAGLESVGAGEAAGEGDVCAVCLEPFEEGGGTPKRTPCGHVFHEKCLANWFKVARTCPVCRVDVVEQAAPDNRV